MDKVNEIERMLNLIGSYTQKLKELQRSYKSKKENKLLILTVFASALLITSFAIMLFSTTNTKYPITSIALAAISLILVLMLLTLINLSRDSRTSRDLFDEIALLRKQLKQLIAMLSQYNEHMITNYISDVIRLEINLKLIEAEDIIEKTNKIPGSDK